LNQACWTIYSDIRYSEYLIDMKDGVNPAIDPEKDCRLTECESISAAMPQQKRDDRLANAPRHGRPVVPINPLGAKSSGITFELRKPFSRTMPFLPLATYERADERAAVPCDAAVPIPSTPSESPGMNA
jgi:hypothetical protein